MKRSPEKLGEAIPQLSCDWPSLQVTYARSLVDLAALRFYPLTLGGQALPAAGLPWFMTLFGRDSMITSYQALPFASELAVSTLHASSSSCSTRSSAGLAILSWYGSWRWKPGLRSTGSTNTGIAMATATSS